MRLLVDLYKIKDPYSGLGQFSLHFATALLSNIPDDFQVTFLLPRGDFPSLNGLFATKRAGVLTRYISGMNRNFDIWHSLHQFPSHFPARHAVHLLTIHDLNFLVEKKGDKQQRYLTRLQRNVNKADYLTAISNFTAQTAADHLHLQGKNIKVIYNGVHFNQSHSTNPPSFFKGGNYFFSIGVFSPKKNFHSLVPLMHHFTEFSLIIAGNAETPYGKELKAMARRFGLADRVFFPGTLNNQERDWLYLHCSAFLFPSVAEGFGMPVIEAMHSGKPVFISDKASLPEIGGSNAFYFSDFDELNMVGCIKEGMAHYYSNPTLHAEQMVKNARRFSWDSCINQYITLYRLIAGKKN